MLTPTPAAPSGELLPCPFCGKRVEFHQHEEDCWFRIDGVGAPGNKLVAAWNRRAAVSQAAPEQAITARAWQEPNGAVRENIRDFLSLGFVESELTPLYALAAPSGAPKQPSTALSDDYLCAIHRLARAHTDVWAETANPYSGVKERAVYLRKVIELAATGTVQSAPVLPDWRENVASQCDSTATSNIAYEVLVDAGKGTLRELLHDAAKAIRAAQSTPVQVEGQQEQTLLPSCDSALRPEPGIPVTADTATLLTESRIADLYEEISSYTLSDDDRHSVNAFARAIEVETLKLSRNAGSARQGGEHAPEIVQAVALPVAAAPESPELKAEYDNYTSWCVETGKSAMSIGSFRHLTQERDQQAAAPEQKP